MNSFSPISRGLFGNHFDHRNHESFIRRDRQVVLFSIASCWMGIEKSSIDLN
jgi:hypothetical protein